MYQKCSLGLSFTGILEQVHGKSAEPNSLANNTIQSSETTVAYGQTKKLEQSGTKNNPVPNAKQ